MDVAPKDRGEDVRREICFTLIDMGIQPEASHHEEGPGQNEIDFRYSDALSAGRSDLHVQMGRGNGRHGQRPARGFPLPKPLSAEAGSGMHVNMSVTSDDGQDHQDAFMAGILAHIREITLFLNPHTDSYLRLGRDEGTALYQLVQGKPLAAHPRIPRDEKTAASASNCVHLIPAPILICATPCSSMPGSMAFAAA